MALRKVALLTQRRSVRCPSSVTARPFPVRQWQHRAAAAARRHSTERLRPPNAASRSHGARRFGVPAWAVRSAAHRRPHAGFPRSVPVIPARRGTAGAVTPRGGSVPPPRPPRHTRVPQCQHLPSHAPSARSAACIPLPPSAAAAAGEGRGGWGVCRSLWSCAASVQDGGRDALVRGVRRGCVAAGDALVQGCWNHKDAMGVHLWGHAGTVGMHWCRDAGTIGMQL